MGTTTRSQSLPWASASWAQDLQGLQVFLELQQETLGSLDL